MIDPADYQARVAAARAALAEAEGARASQSAGRALAAADVARYRPLAERGLLSPARMQQLEIQARQAGGGAAAANAAVEVAAAQVAVSLQAVTIVNLCTICHGDLFFPYRREGKVNGTMISAIGLPASRR